MVPPGAYGLPSTRTTIGDRRERQEIASPGAESAASCGGAPGSAACSGCIRAARRPPCCRSALPARSAPPREARGAIRSWHGDCSRCQRLSQDGTMRWWLSAIFLLFVPELAHGEELARSVPVAGVERAD